MLLWYPFSIVQRITGNMRGSGAVEKGRNQPPG